MEHFTKFISFRLGLAFDVARVAANAFVVWSAFLKAEWADAFPEVAAIIANATTTKQRNLITFLLDIILGQRMRRL